MGKLKIQQGGFVMVHRNTAEVYKVLEVHNDGVASLIDAENRHKGVYQLDELTPVRNEKVLIMKKYEVKK